jgi:methylated-DNA-protein-cysteine methyltransferase-like protein
VHFVDPTAVRRAKSTLCSDSVHFVDLTNAGLVKSTLCTLRASPHCRRGRSPALRNDVAVPSRADSVLARIRDTPPGFVRAYGDVSPGAPRFAGTDDPTVPWHRIVRADGSLAKGHRQRALLEAEGVPFRGERVDMRVARLPA